MYTDRAGRRPPGGTGRPPGGKDPFEYDEDEAAKVEAKYGIPDRGINIPESTGGGRGPPPARRKGSFGLQKGIGEQKGPR